MKPMRTYVAERPPYGVKAGAGRVRLLHPPPLYGGPCAPAGK